MGCAADPPNITDQIDDCVEQEQPMPTTVVFGGDTVNIQARVPITDAKTIQGRQKREDESKVKDDKCCITVDKIQECCCEEIAKQYKLFLQKNDLTAATNLATVDPFYLACQEKSKGFEKKIGAIFDEVFNNK